MQDFSPTQRRGQTLIGVLVSIFLLIGLAAFFLVPRGTGDKPQKSALKASMDKGEGVVLNSNINQIKQGISMFKSDNDGKPPASLDELKHYLKDYPAEMWINPLDKKPLVYDPATGTICAEGPSCPAPGAPAAASAANPPPPGANPPPPAPSAPSSPTGPGGIHMNIPQPGAGAADAMKDSN